MDRIGKKYKSIVIILTVLFVLLLAAVLFFTRDLGSHRSYLGGHPLRISELMSRNTSVPNADGILCDWIEIENRSEGSFDLSGYKLSDSITGAKYSFPTGTLIPAGGYLVVSCSATEEGESYAPFGLHRDGGETVILMNGGNTVIDEVVTLATPKNSTMIRQEDGSLLLSSTPTPGFENTAAGYEAYLASCGETDRSVRLNEVMSSNSLYYIGGLCSDWVELHNLSDRSADISGYMLSDTLGSYNFAFPSGTIIPPRGYLLVNCSEIRGDGSALCAPFALSRQGGETLILTDASALVLDHVDLPAMKQNESYALTEDGWAISAYATPGFENTEAGHSAYQSAQGYDSVSVIVSEAVSANLAMVADAEGDFPDWLELCNTGSETADLSGWYLSDDESDPVGWRIPDGTTLAPGDTLLVFASGKSREGDELHASFSLSDGESAVLATPTGKIVSILPLRDLKKGEAAAVRGSEITATRFVTPGYENSDEGFIALQENAARSSPLLIDTVVVSNASAYYQPESGGYHDYVIVKNVSSAPVELGGYSITDDWEEPSKWQLPAGQLHPQETRVYFCSGDEGLTHSHFIHANFSLSAEADALYLYSAEGLADYVYLHDIPPNSPYCRRGSDNGFWYVQEASATEPERAFRAVSTAPLSLGAEGVFNGVDSVTVELSAADPIYYTTDGSIPTTASTRYEGPFTVDKTTVVRASCITADKLPGRPLTLSYIINENHSFPVASLVADPSDLFYSGIYDTFWNDREVEASVSFFEEDGAFSINCGIEMYGHTALMLDKRSFKLNFRPRYEGFLSYDVFDNDIRSYASLVLRAGQDYPYAIFRDELFGDLCAEFTDDVLVQENKFCILYLNGEYWGIYIFKEAFSEEFYAAHRNVDPATVTREQAPVSPISPFRPVIDFAKHNDMSLDENYQTFCDMVNIDSLIDWAIMEGYSANSDIQQNLRYFRSTQNGNRWEYAFYDLDWAFYYDVNNMRQVFYGVGETGETLQHSTYCMALLNNEDFCHALCTRLAEALGGVLSDENVLAHIDRLEAQLEPEVARERERWGSSVESWHGRVQELRNFINNDWQEKLINGAVEYCRLTPEEKEAYFGGLLK